jgi:glycerate dehydrogenase
MKIVILDGHAVNPGDLSWDCFLPFGSITVYENTEKHQAIQRVEGADIVMTNKTPITRALLDACPTVKLICVLATGYNVVDCIAARERGIQIPTDVDVFGFDSVETCSMMHPPLPVVHQPEEEIGQMAATYLVQRLSGYTGAARHTKLKCRIVEK